MLNPSILKPGRFPSHHLHHDTRAPLAHACLRLARSAFVPWPTSLPISASRQAVGYLWGTPAIVPMSSAAGGRNACWPTGHRGPTPGDAARDALPAAPTETPPAPAAGAPASLPPTGTRPASRARTTTRTAAPVAPPSAPVVPVAPPPAAETPTLGPIPPLSVRARLVILRACEAERRTYCGNAPPGRGRIVECLAANAGVLSPECRQTIIGMTR